MDILGTLDKPLTLILVLGVVITFHEFGHYLAARLFNVKVEVFSFGFGPRLFGWRRGETDYRVCLIPLGGYVRMAGEGSEEQAEAEAAGAEPAPRSPRDFESQSTVAKLIIMAAGPIFNFALALLLLAGAYMGGVEVAAYLQEPARIGSVEADSPAARAGLQPGDLVLSIDGKRVDRWEPLLETILVSPNAELVVEVERAGERKSVPVRVESRTKHAVGWLGILPCSRVVVRSVAEGGAAAQAGVRPGDEIVSLGGQAPCSVRGLIERIQAAAGSPQELVVLRGGATVSMLLSARQAAPDKPWMLGIGPGEATVEQRHGPWDALRESVKTNVRQTGLLIETLAKLVTGRLSVRTMSGPLELADITEDAAESGLVSVVSLMALISLNLGIFNLLPIPILDGGRIFILLAEALRGREFDRRTKEWILTAGVAMIVLLMGLVFWFDIIKKLEG